MRKNQLKQRNIEGQPVLSRTSVGTGGRTGSHLKSVNFLGDGTAALVGAAAVAAVRLGDLPIFHKNLHHPGVIQLAAIAGKKVFGFHLSLLRYAEAPGGQDQTVRRDHLQVKAHEDGACPDFPGVGTAVAADPVGLPRVASGEANVPISCLEEPDIPQPESGMLPAELSQMPEMV